MNSNMPTEPQFVTYYQKHQKCLKLNGLQPKTIEAYSRAIRRIDNYFDYGIDNLSTDQLLDYFHELLDSHSWSTVKLDLYGLKFFYTNVLGKMWADLPLVKPQKTFRIPDILSTGQLNQLLVATTTLSYKVFFFTAYSMGLRLGEGIKLTVGDIDAVNMRVHIRDAKGNKDRLIPLPHNTLHVLRQFWSNHKHPHFLFPSRKRGVKNAHLADQPLDRGGIQVAMKTVVDQLGIKKNSCHFLLPSHKKALQAMKRCRSEQGLHMLARCTAQDCTEQVYIPHSCGHRSCPHCTNHENWQWIENQLSKRLPTRYYLLTFTLPKQLREIAWKNQRTVYSQVFACVQDVLKTFTKNDKKLRGSAGFTTVLHTHARNLDFHPHLHVVMPGASINKKTGLWRVKSSKYLFNHKNLAKVFRAKLLEAIVDLGLNVPATTPKDWVVD